MIQKGNDVSQKKTVIMNEMNIVLQNYDDWHDMIFFIHSSNQGTSFP